MNDMTTMSPRRELAMLPDQPLDLFHERGFDLAQRIAKAFASSDAVPAQFRSMNLKKIDREEKWVENDSAIGNCLVAIEMARAIRMSIVAVMQNADMIEGKLRWSGKFVIAAINASGRFTPLRFQLRNLGPIEATYKEKTGWDEKARRVIYTERKVNVDNIECIAWALPRGTHAPGIYTLQQAREANLPVVESAPVTMKMVVEEGWYAKAGSKWQTELRTLMFQYRAGTFFGNIHAPDIVMGMGPTAEETRDQMPMADVIDMPSIGSVDQATGEILAPTAAGVAVARQVAAQRRAEKLRTATKAADNQAREAGRPAESPVAASSSSPVGERQGQAVPVSTTIDSDLERFIKTVRNAPDAEFAALEMDAARTLGWPNDVMQQLVDVYRETWQS